VHARNCARVSSSSVPDRHSDHRNHDDELIICGNSSGVHPSSADAGDLGSTRASDGGVNTATEARVLQRWAAPTGWLLGLEWPLSSTHLFETRSVRSRNQCSRSSRNLVSLRRLWTVILRSSATKPDGAAARQLVQMSAVHERFASSVCSKGCAGGSLSGAMIAEAHALL